MDAWSLVEIVEQLRLCGYECEGGRLEDNVAFVALVEIAGVKDERYVVCDDDRVGVFGCDGCSDDGLCISG